MLQLQTDTLGGVFTRAMRASLLAVIALLTSALSFFKNQDDQLATVVLDTNRAPLGRQTLSDRNGSTLMVEVHQ